MVQELVQTILRTIWSFGFLLIMNRILGKHSMAQMTNHDFITMVMLGAIAANLAFNSSLNFWLMTTSLLLIAVLGFFTTRLSWKSRAIRKWLDGTPTLLIQDGKLLEHNLKKENFSIDMFKQALREKEIFDWQEVETAILETDGTVTVLKKPEYLPVTRKDLNIPVAKRHRPIELIIDGEVNKENLLENDLSEEWLKQEILRRGYGIQDVFYAVLDSKGRLVLDTYRDHLHS
ncbi:DUF421 domain-containing protein [Halalkalibacterium halodurans]|uniref:DUF421 domain-containing protein n=1 Tax=Halalkalibacterium halodurans TaxID=86665 RepID=UPI001068766C|nr:DUF421 domain-containing protein [Halalkalibacterium halodurans]TES57498.1 DUF421 domain-containing protein [Halalkalibacterium halodurans]